jgi:hypothetical protein
MLQSRDQIIIRNFDLMKSAKKFDLMNSISWKSDFWSHEIWPPDPESNSCWTDYYYWYLNDLFQKTWGRETVDIKGDSPTAKGMDEKIQQRKRKSKQWGGAFTIRQCQERQVRQLLSNIEYLESIFVWFAVLKLT